MVLGGSFGKEVSSNIKTMETINCPNCDLTTLTPMIHCMRCQQLLVQEVTAEAQQIVLRFVGGPTRSLALYRREQPVKVKQVRLNGHAIFLTLEGDQPLEVSAVELFKVLCRGQQLWELE